MTLRGERERARERETMYIYIYTHYVCIYIHVSSGVRLKLHREMMYDTIFWLTVGKFVLEGFG